VQRDSGCKQKELLSNKLSDLDLAAAAGEGEVRRAREELAQLQVMWDPPVLCLLSLSTTSGTADYSWFVSASCVTMLGNCCFLSACSCGGSVCVL
jgi:hypothetical protein